MALSDVYCIKQFPSVSVCGHVWTRSCFPLGWEGTFAFYKFLPLWWGTFVVLKMKSYVLEVFKIRFGKPNSVFIYYSTIKIHTEERIAIWFFFSVAKASILVPTPFSRSITARAQSTWCHTSSTHANVFNNSKIAWIKQNQVSMSPASSVFFC